MEDNLSWLKNKYRLGNTYALLQQVDEINSESFIINIDNSYFRCKNEIASSIDELTNREQEKLLEIIDVRITTIQNCSSLNESELRIDTLLKLKEKAQTVLKIKPKSTENYSLNTQLLFLECSGVIEKLSHDYDSDMKLANFLSLVLNKSPQNIRRELGLCERHVKESTKTKFIETCQNKGYDGYISYFEENLERKSKK